jgi:hypothetical protein
MSVSPAPSDEPADLGSSSPESWRRNLPVPLAAVLIEATQESIDPEAPPIELLAFELRSEEAVSAKPAPARASPDWRRIAAAVSLAAVVTIGVAAAAVHVGETRAASAESATAHALSDRLDAMSARLESLDANRTHDEVTNFRKVLAEIKNSVAGARNVSDGVNQLNARVDRLEKEQGGKFDKLGDRMDRDAANRLADIANRLDKLEAKAITPTAARDLSGAVAQLGGRLDHIEKDQSARLDKLGERLDHDASGRNVELTARLEKLEAKMAGKPAVAAIAPSAAKPTPVASSAATKFAPSVSDEVTGSIERPRPQLRGYYLSEVHNGYAMIDSPAGVIAVAPGDMLPGGGRVLRIERRGRTWAVVTTQGQIAAMDD